MWYAVETAFIDGKWFGSRCLFDKGSSNLKGHCYSSHNVEPMNQCQKLFDNRIEIHTDWFESEQLAEDFVAGKITYQHTYHTWYNPSIKSTLKQFIKREIISVDEKIGFPRKGRCEYIPQKHKPNWA